MRPERHDRSVWRETFLQPWPALPIGVAVLLAGSFLYVWMRVEPALEYHSYGPYFYRHRGFFEAFLDRPGGLVAYAGVFLAQLNCLNWLGALLFVLSDCAVLVAALVCLARVSGRAPGWVSLVPVFVLLLLRNGYGRPVPAITVGLFLALAAAAVHLAVPWSRLWLWTTVGGLVSTLLFLLAGLWSALLFAVLGCLYAVVRARHRAAGLGCLVLAAAAPGVALATGTVELAGLVKPWPDGIHWVLAAALYASVPLAAAGLALVPQRAAAQPAQLWTASPANAAPAPGPGRWARAARWRMAGIPLLFLLGCAVVGLAFDGRRKLLMEIDYRAGRGEYEAVLAAARRVKVLDHPAKARLLLALYHTGRLPDDLFSFHDLVEEAPLERFGEEFRAQTQPLFELGLINDAEHTAHEALELEGDRPDLLRLLAHINLLKDRPQAAQVFLNVLSLVPFQGQPANDAWPTSAPQVPVTDLARLTGLRARMLTNDVLHDGLPVGRLLELVLAAQPTNRMAFEYLMAYHLLDLELKEAVRHLRLLDRFDYPRIPRAYEEALLLFEQTAGIRVELNGRTIRPETLERFRQFREAVRQFTGRAEDQAALAAAFGDTYWYYYYAVRSRLSAAEAQAARP